MGGLAPDAQRAALEALLRLAFAHPAVAGVDLGDLWDEGNALPRSGLYDAERQPKPAARLLDALWRGEWHTAAQKALTSDGSLELDAYYGRYQYEVRSGERVCAGTLLLQPPSAAELLRRAAMLRQGDGLAAAPVQQINVQCIWASHVHLPAWISPVVVALIAIAFLLACFHKRQELLRTASAGQQLPQVASW